MTRCSLDGRHVCDSIHTSTGASQRHTRACNILWPRSLDLLATLGHIPFQYTILNLVYPTPGSPPPSAQGHNYIHRNFPLIGGHQFLGLKMRVLTPSGHQQSPMTTTPSSSAPDGQLAQATAGLIPRVYMPDAVVPSSPSCQSYDQWHGAGGSTYPEGICYNLCASSDTDTKGELLRKAMSHLSSPKMLHLGVASAY